MFSVSSPDDILSTFFISFEIGETTFLDVNIRIIVDIIKKLPVSIDKTILPVTIFLYSNSGFCVKLSIFAIYMYSGIASINIASAIIINIIFI